jgi:DNA ligase-1
VRAAALSLSPTFTAAAGLLGPLDPARGLALRFPRFVRARPDKPPHLATTTAQLAQMFTQQPEFEAAAAQEAAARQGAGG